MYENIKKEIKETVENTNIEAEKRAEIYFNEKEIKKAFYNNQYGDADLIIKLFKNRYLRDNSSGEVYEWQGSHWAVDINLNYEADLRELSEIYKKEAVEKKKENGEDKLIKKYAKDLLARANNCLSRGRTRHIMELAFTGDGSLGISGAQWNANPYWLPCKNVTVDLANGYVIDSKPEHFFNKYVPYEYKGLNEKAPVWEDIIAKALGFKEELISYFKYFVGAAATGISTKDFFCAFGPSSSNGKSLIFETLAKALGGFAGHIDVSLLLEQKYQNPGAPQPELLKLNGLRLAITSEADNNQYFNLGRVKFLTSGGDTITARNLNSKNFQSFQQTQTLIIHSNKLPQVASGDIGFGERLKVFPFYARFLPEAEDNEKQLIFKAIAREDLNIKLEQEMSGIIAYIVNCAIKFIANGARLPQPPQIVQDETSEYRLEQDVVQQFIDDCCETHPESSIEALELYDNFAQWYKDNLRVERARSATWFGREMKGKFRKTRNEKGYKYIGINIDERKQMNIGQQSKIKF